MLTKCTFLRINVSLHGKYSIFAPRFMLYRFVILLLLCTTLRAQTLIPNMPPVYIDTTTFAPGVITSFEHDSASKKLYIAGQFVRVGSVNRQGFAVIDMTTGAVLNELTSIFLMDLSNLLTVRAKIKLHNNSIYVGGTFQQPYYSDYLFAVNLTTGNYTGLYVNSPISDFEIYNDKIYTSGQYYLGLPDEYKVCEMDTLGNILWQQSINTAGLSKLHSLEARNNLLFVGGAFTSFGGVSLQNVAKVDLSTHVISSWQPSPLPGPAGNTACFEVPDMIAFPNDVMLSVAAHICGGPPKSISSYNNSSGALNTSMQSLNYAGDVICLLRENDTSFWAANGGILKLYGTTGNNASWSPANNGGVHRYFRKAGYLFVAGNFTTLEGTSQGGYGVYCLAPAAPKRLSTFTQACQGQTRIYNVSQVKYATSYSWTYTGTGVTITGTGSSVQLYFSATATSGTFKICAKSYCGAPGDTLYVPFTVYSPPHVNAGPDAVFTCASNIDTLYGSSNNPGVNYFWNGPLYNSNAPVNQITSATQGGNYILTVADPVSGCMSKDTAKVIFDTLRPAINHNLVYGQLNCNTSVVVLDAASLYPASSSLYWSASSFSQPNPANVTVAGTYTLTITSGTNSCINKDTFSVVSNTVPPAISAPAVLDTITCLRDSVQLPASTTTLNTLLYWKNSNGDSLLNYSYTQTSGAYSAHAHDTSNGCSSQLIRTVNQFTTPPDVQILPGLYMVNCSASSVTLSGSSATAGATLSWSGPGGFTSVNPGVTASPGTYYLTAVHPQNGCTKADSVTVTQQNILLLNTSADTTICNGASAVLSAAAIGGTPAFTYSWNNNAGTASTATVSPTDTTAYVVTITDSAGCVGTDTIMVTVPAPMGDSAQTFQPCDPANPNGQVHAYGTGGIPPYQFSLNSGAFQQSGIFSNLNFGTYSVTVVDSLGCSTVFTALIDSSSVLPSPDFILSTTQIHGDTFVLVDISNPRLDSVQWILPASATIINTDPFAPQIVHADTGTFQVTMVAWFGTCMMQLSKNIAVIPLDTTVANSYNNNGIASLNLYPNPNTGQFTVGVTFYKKQSFAIFIYDATGNEVLRAPFADTDAASVPVTLNSPAPGAYIMKVVAEFDSKHIIFLVEQQ